MKITKEDKEWAKKVKDRDGWKCVICQDEKRPNAHHIIPKQIKATRLDVMNGITLCPSHHRFSWKLSAHQNPLAFFMWMMKNKKQQLAYLSARV